MALQQQQQQQQQRDQANADALIRTTINAYPTTNPSHLQNLHYMQRQYMDSTPIPVYRQPLDTYGQPQGTGPDQGLHSAGRPLTHASIHSHVISPVHTVPSVPSPSPALPTTPPLTGPSPAAQLHGQRQMMQSLSKPMQSLSSPSPRTVIRVDASPIPPTMHTPTATTVSSGPLPTATSSSTMATFMSPILPVNTRTTHMTQSHHSQSHSQSRPSGHASPTTAPPPSPSPMKEVQSLGSTQPSHTPKSTYVSIPHQLHQPSPPMHNSTIANYRQNTTLVTKKENYNPENRHDVSISRHDVPRSEGDGSTRQTGNGGTMRPAIISPSPVGVSLRPSSSSSSSSMLKYPSSSMPLTGGTPRGHSMIDTEDDREVDDHLFDLIDMVDIQLLEEPLETMSTEGHDYGNNRHHHLHSSSKRSHPSSQITNDHLHVVSPPPLAMKVNQQPQRQQHYHQQQSQRQQYASPNDCSLLNEAEAAVAFVNALVVPQQQ